MAIDSVVSNFSALSIIQEIRDTNDRIGINVERISTGLRVNSSTDDSTSFSLGKKLETDILSLSTATESLQRDISLTNIALNSVDAIISSVQELRNIALEASNSSQSDSTLRNSLQTQVQERLQEVQDIVNNTKFSGTPLLNGIFSSTTDFQSGTRDFGGSVAFGPFATNLTQNAFLKIGLLSSGSSIIKSGNNDSVFNTGLGLSKDIAVSTAQFLSSGAVPALTVSLATTQFTANRVTLDTNSVLSFSGKLANGTNTFGGSLSITVATQFQDLINAVQSAIDTAESSISINSTNGTNALETNVSVTQQGRLKFSSAQAGDISQFGINFSLINNTGNTQTTFGITRDSVIFNQEVSLSTITGARIGNSPSSITGSTFSEGEFNIDVLSVTSASNRIIQSSTSFFSNASLTTPVIGTDFIRNAFIGTISISVNDTIQVNGTDPDGTTFSVEFTVVNPANTDPTDGLVREFDDLIAELNNRDRTDTGFGFNQAVATLNSGAIRIEDDVSNTSQTNLTFMVTEGGSSQTVQVNSNVVSTGAKESATISIDSGTRVTAEAGSVVTLTGSSSSSTTDNLPQVTLRLGNNFSVGTDVLVNSPTTFQGQLNNGTVQTFNNGESDVTFFGTSFQSSSADTPRVTLDFDAIVDITIPFSQDGETFVLSTTSRPLSFQNGIKNEGFSFLSLGNLSPENLGSSTGNSLIDLNVTTISSASESLNIIDDAMSQLIQISGTLGGFADSLSNREGSLALYSDNLTTAQNNLITADIATEISELTLNTTLLEAQTDNLVNTLNRSSRLIRLLLNLPQS